MKKLPKDHSRELLKWLPHGSKVTSYTDRSEYHKRYHIKVPEYLSRPALAFDVWVPNGTHPKACVIDTLLAKTFQVGKETGSEAVRKLTIERLTNILYPNYRG